MIDADFVPKLAAKARLRFDRHEDKWMIVYPERGLALNDSAAAIAHKLDGTNTIAAIADDLAKEHDADRAAVEKNIIAFVTSLHDKGLLES